MNMGFLPKEIMNGCMCKKQTFHPISKYFLRYVFSVCSCFTKWKPLSSHDYFCPSIKIIFYLPWNKLKNVIHNKCTYKFFKKFLNRKKKRLFLFYYNRRARENCTAMKGLVLLNFGTPPNPICLFENWFYFIYLYQP